MFPSKILGLISLLSAKVAHIQFKVVSEHDI